MRAWLPLLLVLGCSGDAPSSDDLEFLQPREQLIRLSVDLRGVHPTEAELVAFEGGSLSWHAAADAWLDDPRFLDRVEEVVNDRLLTRVDDTYFDADELGVSRVDEGRLVDAIGGEPLKLARWIVANDRPWTELVTADHTMASPLLAELWDIEHPGGTGWQPAQYRDGRPHAGILSMTTTWQRYPSMGGNANRHRANAISKMLLCDDYLERPIVLNRAAVDQLVIDPEQAIATNPTCQSCHSTLDPLSANLFGFFTYDEEDGIGRTVYHPELEEGWRDYAGREPGYFGRPVGNLVELGAAIGDDPRFVDCAVQTFWEGFTQRTLDPADWSEVQRHREVFEQTDLRVKELVRSIVAGAEYRARRSTDPELDARLAGVKTATPAQLASIIEGLTGYRWAFDEREMRHDARGLAVLAGGVDGRYVTERSYAPGVGTAFTHERLAQAAGWHVARADLDPERVLPAKLLVHVDRQMVPDASPIEFRQQFDHLYLTITGLPAPEGSSAALDGLWRAIYAVDADPEAAWAGVVSAVLRDPRVLFY
ncbi:MAG: hypothetical protein ACI8PZ_004087 [Myxococcota bacterium]|jgi:hypothetical protein